MTKISNEYGASASDCTKNNNTDKERDDKISNIQRLVDEGLASGISDSSMDDILAKGKLNYQSTIGKK